MDLGLWEEGGMCVCVSGLKKQGIDFLRYLTSTNLRHRAKLEIQQQQGFIFLDLKITVGRLHAPIYRKTSDRNTIPKADSWKFQRLRRTCSNDDVFDPRGEDMYRRFEQRGYLKKNVVLVQTLIKANFFKQKQHLLNKRLGAEKLPPWRHSPLYICLTSNFSERFRKAGQHSLVRSYLPAPKSTSWFPFSKTYIRMWILQPVYNIKERQPSCGHFKSRNFLLLQLR